MESAILVFVNKKSELRVKKSFEKIKNLLSRYFLGLVMMVEGEMDECSEEEMADAIKFAHDAIKDHEKRRDKILRAAKTCFQMR